MGLFDKLFGGKSGGSKNEPPKFASFTSSDSLMDEDLFWEVIKTSSASSDNNFERQQAELAKELRNFTPEEVISFSNRFRYFRGQANTWELWGAIYIIHGGCGDDGFSDFRGWVIGQGKDFYDKTIKDPESLVDIEADRMKGTEWEGLGYVPATVFKELTAQEMPYPYQENTETTGKQWQEGGNDLKKMFPKLYTKYHG